MLSLENEAGITRTLVRDPSQRAFEENMNTPTPVEEFRTGFVNASMESLQAFTEEHHPRGFGTPDTFPVIDGRSPRDNTVVIVHGFQDLDEVEDTNDQRDATTTWKTFRFRLQDMAQAVGDMDMTPDIEYRWYLGDDICGEDGVFPLPNLSKEW